MPFNASLTVPARLLSPCRFSDPVSCGLGVGPGVMVVKIAIAVVVVFVLSFVVETGLWLDLLKPTPCRIISTLQTLKGRNDKLKLSKQN
jgi:hypothetical protein